MEPYIELILYSRVAQRLTLGTEYKNSGKQSYQCFKLPSWLIKFLSCFLVWDGSLGI